MDLTRARFVSIPHPHRRLFPDAALRKATDWSALGEKGNPSVFSNVPLWMNRIGQLETAEADVEVMDNRTVSQKAVEIHAMPENVRMSFS